MSDQITETTSQTYNKIAADYAQRWGDFTLPEPLAQFTEHVKPGGLVLDLGTGPGRDVLELQERGYRVIGLDRSWGMLKQAKACGADPLVLADMRHLPFADHALDGIWACASMLHLPKSDLIPTLHEAHRVLHHGHIYVSLKEGQTESWESNEFGEQRFFAYYHPAEVELALERADFHVMWFDRTPDSRGYNWISAIGWTKLKKVAAGATAVIFNDDGQVLLTRRSDNHLWCVPGGHMDPGEPIEQTAIREALEETGLEVEIERLSGMYTVDYPAHMFREKQPRSIFTACYRCRVLGGELTLNDEVTEFGWFDPDDLPDDLMMNQEMRIRDAA